tara:strand:- start:2421 stop:2948 length:528 start_codon:yes stop_codon:yes gene_type:complete
MNIKDKFLGLVAKFKELSHPKKILALLIIAIIVVGILVAAGVIPKETIFPSAVGVDEFGVPSTPSVPGTPKPTPTNEVVNGWFRGTHDCYIKSDDGVDVTQIEAYSIEECVEIGKGITGALVAGYRNDTHPSLKNTCFFYKCMGPDYNKNDTMHTTDTIHTMTCINDAENFEDCS